MVTFSEIEARAGELLADLLVAKNLGTVGDNDIDAVRWIDNSRNMLFTDKEESPTEDEYNAVMNSLTLEERGLMYTFHGKHSRRVTMMVEREVKAKCAINPIGAVNSLLANNYMNDAIENFLCFWIYSTKKEK